MAPSKIQPPQAKTKTVSGHPNARRPTASTSIITATIPATSFPGVARPVVLPAIPLPMMQKQSAKPSSKAAPTTHKKHASTANNSANGFPVASLDAALIDQVVSPNGPKDTKYTKDAKGQHLQSAKPSENGVNGSSVEKPEHVITQTDAIPATTTPTATTTTNGTNATTGYARASVGASLNGTNGIDHHSRRTTAPGQTSSTPPSAEVESNAADSASTSTADIKLGNTKSRSQSQISHLNHKHLQSITGAQDDQSYTSQTESLVSPRRINQPHVLNSQIHALNHQQPADRRLDPSIFHHTAAHMHRHQMSNGGIMFGGLPESHTPSPSPHPGAFMPPPPVPGNGENPNFARVNGHHHHAQSNGNGFPAPVPAPINTQFRPDLAGPVSSIDAYGPLSAHVPQGHFEAFPPGASRYGPPTPHSFHGSHASGEPNGMDSGPTPFPPNNMHYPGHGGHNEHPAGHHHQQPPHHHHPHAPFPPFPPSQLFARRHQGMVEGELIQNISYLRNQFDNGELADCVLELVYAKGRHHPVKITGHKLILAQSPALKHYIMSAARTGGNSGSHTITVESDDAYLRSDAWWMAVQRLYMHTLLNIPPIIGNGANGMDFAGDKADRFEFCLGYAAAGHLLRIQDVLVRGLQIAADLLNWVTIEDALGFVVEGTSQRHTDFGVEQDGMNTSFVELEYGYGPETKILMDAIMNFLINAFPPNFELDPSIPDPVKYARIPPVPIPAAVTSPRGSLPPAIARGSNQRNVGKSARLGSIKFGDLPPTFPEDGPVPQRESAKCSPVLSRILLNLPFDELREVLTSESHGVSGWNTAQDRYHAVVDVVVAREAKRLRAVDAIRARAVPNALDIQQRLSAQRRHAVVEPWDVLNWREEVMQPRGAEVPRLARTWIPQFSAPSEAELQRQAPAPAYDAPESMV